MGYIVGGLAAMFAGGALLNAGGYTLTLVAAVVGLLGGMYCKFVWPRFYLELSFFYLLLAAGFSFWLDKN